MAAFERRRADEMGRLDPIRPAPDSFDVIAPSRCTNPIKCTMQMHHAGTPIIVGHRSRRLLVTRVLVCVVRACVRRRRLLLVSREAEAGQPCTIELASFIDSFPVCNKKSSNHILQAQRQKK